MEAAGSGGCRPLSVAGNLVLAIAPAGQPCGQQHHRHCRSVKQDNRAGPGRNVDYRPPGRAQSDPVSGSSRRRQDTGHAEDDEPFRGRAPDPSHRARGLFPHPQRSRGDRHDYRRRQSLSVELERPQLPERRDPGQRQWRGKVPQFSGCNFGNSRAQLRESLGEPTASLRKFDKPLALATSPSLDALQAYTQALAASGGPTTVPLLQRALESDPDFASRLRSARGLLRHRQRGRSVQPKSKEGLRFARSFNPGSATRLKHSTTSWIQVSLTRLLRPTNNGPTAIPPTSRRIAI